MLQGIHRDTSSNIPNPVIADAVGREAGSLALPSQRLLLPLSQTRSWDWSTIQHFLWSCHSEDGRSHATVPHPERYPLHHGDWDLPLAWIYSWCTFTELRFPRIPSDFPLFFFFIKGREKHRRKMRMKCYISMYPSQHTYVLNQRNVQPS